MQAKSSVFCRSITISYFPQIRSTVIFVKRTSPIIQRSGVRSAQT